MYLLFSWKVANIGRGSESRKIVVETQRRPIISQQMVERKGRKRVRISSIKFDGAIISWILRRGSCSLEFAASGL